MIPTVHAGSNPLIRKLESVFTLTDEERQALETLPMQVMTIKDRQDIVREGDQPSRSCLILSGFACVYKMTAQGRRQIVSLHHRLRHPRHPEPAPEGAGQQHQHHQPGSGSFTMTPCARSAAAIRALPSLSGARP
jgi:CRP-like cAMP-binding protein